MYSSLVKSQQKLYTRYSHTDPMLVAQQLQYNAENKMLNRVYSDVIGMCAGVENPLLFKEGK